MDFIPENKLIKFRPDTLMVIRKNFNLDKPGQMNEAIDLLQDWVNKQGHFLKKDYSREYLERTIILHKGSIEGAKTYIDKLSAYRTLLPMFFDRYDAKQNFWHLREAFSCVLLPNLTEDNYRVFCMKMWNDNYTKSMINDSYNLCTLVSEYLIAKDYCLGLVAVLDYRDIKISNLISVTDIRYMNQALTIMMKANKFRIKGIHYLTSSNTIDVLVKMLKKIFSAKLSNRLYVHTKLESLYEYVPREILPSELNGNEKSLAILSDEWLDELSTKENVEYMKEMLTKAVVDKSYKSLAEFNEIYMGLDGSFRKLSVD